MQTFFFTHLLQSRHAVRYSNCRLLKSILCIIVFLLTFSPLLPSFLHFLFYWPFLPYFYTHSSLFFHLSVNFLTPCVSLVLHINSAAGILLLGLMNDRSHQSTSVSFLQVHHIFNQHLGDIKLHQHVNNLSRLRSKCTGI